MKRSDRQAVIGEAVAQLNDTELFHLSTFTHVPLVDGGWDAYAWKREREALLTVEYMIPGHPIKWATAYDYHTACVEERAKRREATCAGVTT